MMGELAGKKCPFCSAPINWQELIRPPWERQAKAEGWTRFSNFDAGTVKSALASGATYTKRRPIRQARVESDIKVPLIQSIITGVAGGMVVGAGAALAKQGWWSLLWGIAGGAAAWNVSWWILLGSTRSLLWEEEKIVSPGQEKRGSGDDAGEFRQRDPIKVESLERDERGRVRRIRYVTLPVGVIDEDLTSVAQAVLVDNKPFSRRELADAISADKFAGISKAMLNGGLLVYSNGKNNANGVILTASGRAFLRQYVVVAGGGR